MERGTSTKGMKHPWGGCSILPTKLHEIHMGMARIHCPQLVVDLLVKQTSWVQAMELQKAALLRLELLHTRFAGKVAMMLIYWLPLMLPYMMGLTFSLFHLEALLVIISWTASQLDHFKLSRMELLLSAQQVILDQRLGVLQTWHPGF